MTRKTMAVARKEFRQIVRDARTLTILLVVPVFFLLLYGYALNFDIRHVRLAIDDRDHTVESRSLVAAFVHSGYFDLVASISDADASRLMDRNDVRAILVIPAGLGRAVRTHRSAPVQLLLNGDNANTATTVMGYAVATIRNESARYAPAGAAPILAVEPRIWYNPQLRSTLFLVPGLIAFITMITAVVSTALSIVREKERGTMEQVRMAPIGTAAFVVGKTMPYFVVSFVSAFGIIVAAMLMFDMPMRGSWIVLLLTVSLFLAGALGLGLLISSAVETQQVGFQLAILISFLPTFILSGFIFPISSMPRFLQIVTYAIPARYFLTALRAIVLKGARIEAFWLELVALALFATAVLTLAAVRLRRQWSHA
jgi:ABC-2 type transport system permease protein